MQYFAPQLHSSHQSTVSLRASQYFKKRKTRHEEHEDDGNSSSSGSDADKRSRTSRSNVHSHPSFASAELAQLRVAGLLPEDEHRVPPAPFPHAPARVPKPYLGTAKIQKELARPPSQLYTVNSTASQGDNTSSQTEASNLRRTHLNVLSTVMHRCLQEHDYDRAGRAWGMILRTQATHGNTVDLRNHGRWGIGAEILLRRKPHGEAHSNQSHDATNADVDVFSEQGFDLAREYYERLIVQHPTRKQVPHATDQRTFYPAMFSLWIQERSTDDVRSREDAIQVEELARAMEIAERLDDLVKSPPFDKQASLLYLRGQIALWISDLIAGNTAAAIMDEWDPYPIRKDVSAVEQISKFKSCQRELRAAQSYLERSEENGCQQHRQLQKIESRLKELQKQIAGLESGEEDDTNVTMEDDW
ncbi:uncharacterized protein M421DRAFT_67785 [Didymella exigua CBS 183.55]|uniref:Uncharacterized protein n=1 Tax=Didymella exigua CBS 183.55 TaxID=1150837 RepID=A0A6A5RFD9_9PLEO|nr:uncharacterized protein M421DRAFT_67785 [Didymella exigua CBS 183.55]KAF1926432.1 hypothetical protein M421DRAFT_67785 [Didymella exigua CBS 183.55]